MKPEEIFRFIRENNIQIVDLKFNDLPGLWQPFSIPVSELTDIDDPTRGIWADGIGFDGSSIRGFQKIQESDMILIPDPDTVVIDPICEIPTLSIICDVCDPLTKQPYTRDPRYIAKKAEEYLRSTGMADISYWGPEMEFFIFDDIRFDQNERCGYYFLDSIEGAWNTGKEENPNLGYKPRSPDNSSNGYLALAAILMAGLDGIINQIDPGEPLDKDSYHLTPEEAAGIKTVPSSLEEALGALEKDHDYLLRGDVFTPDVIEVWLEYKRTREIDAVRLRPHPYEFYLCFDI